LGLLEGLGVLDPGPEGQAMVLISAFMAYLRVRNVECRECRVQGAECGA